MKQTVNKYDFRRAFETSRPDNFSHEGLGLLFDYLDDTDTGDEYELDVIAICCDWAESPAGEIMRDYNLDLDDIGLDTDDDPDESDIEDALMGYLQERTQVAGSTGPTIVYQSF